MIKLLNYFLFLYRWGLYTTIAKASTKVEPEPVHMSKFAMRTILLFLNIPNNRKSTNHITENVIIPNMKRWTLYCIMMYFHPDQSIEIPLPMWIFIVWLYSIANKPGQFVNLTVSFHFHLASTIFCSTKVVGVQSGSSLICVDLLLALTPNKKCNFVFTFYYFFFVL